jgi:hypothetical protein
MKALGGKAAQPGGTPEDSLASKTKKQPNKERLDLKLL